MQSTRIGLKYVLMIAVLAPVWTAAQAAEESTASQPTKPNVVLIYTDDIGYGDVGCYGATGIPTPAIDRLAENGLRFTDAHCTAATCTPSRFSLLTGTYAFRNERAEILPGDAPLLIEPASLTLPEMFRQAGYTTAVVGKWHLGLGEGQLNWNEEIKPGPREVGFDEVFLLPATNDRVPCVYIEDRQVLNLDPADPIEVSYSHKVGDLPVGREHPELLKYPADNQHSDTIINGISRIGYMGGGKTAWWTDEEMSTVFTQRAIKFIKSNREQPFFLYFSLQEAHEPRLPNPRFHGKSQCGRRGDSIVEADWCVGEVLSTLKKLDLLDNTLVIFSSDNGPVITDGYEDGALENIGEHSPAGPFRGGKYHAWEGGTRMPFIVSWPQRIKPGVSDALLSQVDLQASLAQLIGVELPAGVAPDSKNVLPALMGESPAAREVLLEQCPYAISIRSGNWKYIPAGKRSAWAEAKHGEPGDPTGSAPIGPEAQLYDLSNDPGETTNVIDQHSQIAAHLARQLKAIRKQPRFESH